MEFKTQVKVDKLAASVIKKYHKHLAVGADEQPKVKALLKTTAVGKKMAEQEAGKKPRIAKVHKLSEWMRFLTGISFVIQIDENYWNFLTIEVQTAVIDEALCQMGINDKGPYLIDPDVRIYTAVIERHGFYTEELQSVRARISQLNLFEPNTQEESTH